MKKWTEIIEGWDTDEDETDLAREERADEIAEALEEAGYGATAWTGGRTVRVYVTRELARGRQQDIGYIGIRKDGAAVPHLTRNVAGICAAIGLEQ